jgi:hypothetical protein
VASENGDSESNGEAVPAKPRPRRHRSQSPGR